MKFAYLIEPPFNFRDASGMVTGSDVELARVVLSMIDATPFEPVEAEFADLLPGLVQGRWRMTTGLFATDERRRLVNFSRPIWALSDGLLVRSSHPQPIRGYHSIAQREDCRLAVIRGQVQHQTALKAGIPAARIQLFATYHDAAHAVQTGQADAYASVARAHAGFLQREKPDALALVNVPVREQPPSFGCFGFSKQDEALKKAVDDVLATYLGSRSHRTLMAQFGFTKAEIDLIVDHDG